MPSRPAVLESLKTEHGKLKAGVFEHAHPSRLAGEELVISFPQSKQLMKRMADGREYCEALGEAVRAVTGTGVLVRCELTDEDPVDDDVSAVPRTMSEEELIERLKAEFDAEEIPAEEES